MAKTKPIKLAAKVTPPPVKKEPERTIATNKKAYHNYHVLDGLEAGLALQGTEVKSLRRGKVSINDAFVREEKGQMWLYNAHIAQYESRGYADHDPTRPRKLLLHRKEITKFKAQSQEKNLTIVVTRLYFKKHLAKIYINLAKGKKLYDKREDITKRNWNRIQERALKNN
ncbi:MAG: SsrA-binding protein SmpB [Chloroflexi bacterium]|nr:SsrA-binding protein SmpB [Chloroflexota bacterium]